MFTPARTIGAAAVVAILTAGLAATTPAEAKGSVVSAAGKCSTTHTVSKLKAKPSNGVLEVEFEVDSNRNGHRWAVTLRHDGVIKYSGRRTTLAPSGSFTVDRRIVNAPGVHRISATARNLVTGETCSASLRI